MNCKTCQKNPPTPGRRNCQACETARKRKYKGTTPGGRQVRDHFFDGSAADFEITVEEPAPTAKERIEVTRLRAELDRVRTQLRETERLAATGEGLREILDTLDAPQVVPNPEWLRGASRQRGTHGTAVMFLSDIHFDEVVHPAQIGGANEYNREIATRRLRDTFRNTITLLKGYMSVPRYDGMVCALGGDLLSGNIHEELVETNERPIQQSMLALEEILIEGLAGLADEFGKVHVPCVTGNHGRMHKKPRAKNRAFENFEWSIYQRLAAYFKRDTRLTFDIPDGPDAFFDLYRWKYCLTHGDQFRGGDGIGGIMVPIMRGAARKQVRQRAIAGGFDVLMMGHWHQYIHTQSLVVNGSVKGYDEYAYQCNFPFERPQQAVFVVHPEVGCTFRMPVLCDHNGANTASTLVQR